MTSSARMMTERADVEQGRRLCYPVEQTCQRATFSRMLHEVERARSATKPTKNPRKPMVCTFTSWAKSRNLFCRHIEHMESRHVVFFSIFAPFRLVQFL